MQFFAPTVREVAERYRYYRVRNERISERTSA